MCCNDVRCIYQYKGYCMLRYETVDVNNCKKKIILNMEDDKITKLREHLSYFYRVN